MPGFSGRNSGRMYSKTGIPCLELARPQNSRHDTVSFLWTDSKGSLISAQYVTLSPGLDIAHAKSRAIRHWDSKETARIWQFNLQTCIYWARCRLLRSIYREANEYVQADQVPHDEDFSKLVILATCKALLARAAEILQVMEEEMNQATTRPCWL
ncbi:hypothetical protein V8F06_013388 [Rhypophila decipiens]